VGFSHIDSTWVGKTNSNALKNCRQIMVTLTLKLFEKDAGFPLIVIKPHWPLKQNIQVTDKMFHVNTLCSFTEI
jgi:hypothetical protein